MKPNSPQARGDYRINPPPPMTAKGKLSETQQPTGIEDQEKKRRLRLPLIRRTSADERGLSTLEWILLVAAVGGLATAGVIIVRNAVGGAGDQVDDTARLERIAQTDVNRVMTQRPNGGREGVPHEDTVRIRCNLNYEHQISRTDSTKIKPLLRWRGQFTFRYVEPTNKNLLTPPSEREYAAWCDAVPTNNVANNDVTIVGPPRWKLVNSDPQPIWPK